MKKHTTVQGIFLASIFLIVCGVVLFTSTFDTYAEEANIIQLTAGETLELTTNVRSAGAEFSWILTKDRKFLSGQRTRFFQTRLAEIGTYALDVSIQNTANGENALHSFIIIVGEIASRSLPSQTNIRELALRPIVTTQPSTINNTIYLPPQGGLVKIDPSMSEGPIDKYWIDLDSTLDSDYDGNKTNDRDNAGTLSEKGGTPIYLYALPKQEQQTIRLSVQDLASSVPSSLDLPIIFSAEIPTTTSNSLLTDQGGQLSIQQESLTINMSIDEEGLSWEGKQLLYEWNFGDKNRSLLASPTHTYKSAGIYEVRLTVRDISNAEVLASYSQTIQVSDSSLVNSSVSSAVSSPSSNDKGTAGSGFFLWPALKVLLIIFCLLALALGLYASIAWVKKSSTKSIQKTLEKMEEKIVKSDQIDVETQKPMPIKVTKDIVDLPPKKNIAAVSEREKKQKEFVQEKRTMETPASIAGPVPAWLKSASPVSAPPKPEPKPQSPPPTSIEPKTTPVKPVIPPSSPAPAPAPALIPSPAPKPAPKVIPVIPKDVPAEQAPPAEKIAAQEGPSPAWLKPKQEEKAVPVAEPKKVVVPPAATQPPSQLPVSGNIPKESFVEKETPKKEEGSDPTIAIIKADSLS